MPLTLLWLCFSFSQLKNHDSSCGVVAYLDQPAEKDCVLVEVLKRQGAIPFVKTNLPQSLLR